MELSDARALVVGASGGLGGALAAALAGAGSRLVVTGRDEQRLAAVADACNAVPMALDLSEPGGAERVVQAAATELGRLDLAICCAGTVAFGVVEELDDVVLAQLFEVNVLGPIRLARAAVPALSDDGVLVMLSGIVAEMPTARMAAYSASKAALTAFDRALAREVRRTGIRVLDVCPPHLATGLADRPLAGTAPRLGEGLDPVLAAGRILDAIGSGATEVDFSV